MEDRDFSRAIGRWGKKQGVNESREDQRVIKRSSFTDEEEKEVGGNKQAGETATDRGSLKVLTPFFFLPSSLRADEAGKGVQGEADK